MLVTDKGPPSASATWPGISRPQVQRPACGPHYYRYRRSAYLQRSANRQEPRPPRAARWSLPLQAPLRAKPQPYALCMLNRGTQVFSQYPMIVICGALTSREWVAAQCTALRMRWPYPADKVCEDARRGCRGPAPRRTQHAGQQQVRATTCTHKGLSCRAGPTNMMTHSPAPHYRRLRTPMRRKPYSHIQALPSRPTSSSRTSPLATRPQPWPERARACNMPAPACSSSSSSSSSSRSARGARAGHACSEPASQRTALFCTATMHAACRPLHRRA